MGALCTVGGNIKWYNIFSKIKNRTTKWHSDSTTGHIYKKIESRISKTYLHTHVQSSTIHNSQEVEATQVSTNGWIDKQNVVYAYRRIQFSLKGKEINMCSTYMNLEDIMQSEISQSQKDKYLSIYLYEVFSQIHRDRK